MPGEESETSGAIKLAFPAAVAYLSVGRRNDDTSMHEVLIKILGVEITGWKIVGYSGVFLFSARWLVQLWASRRAEKPVLPGVFWIMSLGGSLLCLAYFVFGKNDSVGILANLFPSAVSVYNLRLEFLHKRRLQKISEPQIVQLPNASSTTSKPRRERRPRARCR